MRQAVLVVLLSIGGIVLWSCSDDESPTGGDTPTLISVNTHQLTAGMWWTETRSDTAIAVDATGTTTTTEEWHTHYSILYSTPGDSGGVMYFIEMADTLVGGADSVFVDTLVLEFINGKLNAAFYDEDLPMGVLYLTMYEFPLSDGSSWTVFSDSLDTTFNIAAAELGLGTLPVDSIAIGAAAGGEGTGLVTGSTERTFGGERQACLTIERNVAMGGDISLGQDIDLGLIVIDSGTAVATVSVVSGEEEQFSADLALALWSRQVDVTTMTNTYDSSTESDTTKSVTTLTSLYNPDWASGDTLLLNP